MSNATIATKKNTREKAALTKANASEKPMLIGLSQSELRILTSLASDQIFRREFIDPKMPGHKAKPMDLAVGKELVLRLQSLLQPKHGLSSGFGTGK